MVGSPEAKKYLWDAHLAAERVSRFTNGRTFSDYTDDEMLRAAVERQFEIIGEAFTGLRRTDAQIAASIPELPQIIAFRNVLIHGYASIDDHLVWDVVTGELPGLVAILRQMLDGP